MVLLNHMNKDNLNNQDLKNLIKIIALGMFTVFSLTTAKVYYTHLSSDKIIELIKDNKFFQISSKIDEKKLNDFLNKENDPYKQIFDPKISYFTTTNYLGIFIEYNLFNKQCEMTSRVMGIWAYLDLLNTNKIPLSINIRTYKVSDDICNRLYGYNRL